MILPALLLVTLLQPPATPEVPPAPPSSEATPPAPAPRTPAEAAAEADFAAALAKDQAALNAQAPAAAVAAPSMPSVTSSPALMNPEMSAILTVSGAYRRRASVAPVFEAHDDAPRDKGSLQEVELTFAADVDPYFKARLFLAIPRLEGIEVEEGYFVSSGLPWNLQIKAGFFRSAFGRNNEQHLHTQDFAVRPWTTMALGHDGLRPAGAQLSVLVPLPWYTVIWAEAFASQERKAAATAGLDQFWDLTDAWSLLLGVSGATLDPGPEVEVEAEHMHAGEPAPMPGAMVVDPGRRELLGADLYLKWRPTNETQTYSWVAFTAEWIGTRERGGAWSGIGYAQLVAQVARRWRLGARADLVGLPEGDQHLQALGGAASIAFIPTEFSRVRFTYQHQRDLLHGGDENDTFFLQLEGTIGAHGAHPF